MTVAVTGGTGVVGTAVVRHLLESGAEVRALARNDDAMAALRELGATPVRGDVLDETSLETLVTRCETVFHVAGVNEMCSRDPARMWRVNVEGALSVLEACTRAGARRLVHTSSAVTMGEPAGTVATEATPHRGHFLSEYERSKTEAERILLGTGRDVEVVAVNPSSVQGPGRSTGTGALLLAAARRRFPFAVDATFSLVDIDDCARGHLLAATEGAPGERYLLSAGVITVREAVSTIRRHLGHPGGPLYLSPRLVSMLAPLVGAASAALGRHPPLCAESARVLRHGHRYDGSRAGRELGLSYRPVTETLTRTVDWFVGEGLLGPD